MKKLAFFTIFFLQIISSVSAQTSSKAKGFVTKQWTTNITELSTTDGTVKTIGFIGKYEITVTGKNGKSTTVYQQLLADGSTVKIKLP